MKTQQKERRLYVRKGIVHLCYDGRIWAAEEGKQSRITARDRVTVEDLRPCSQALRVTLSGKTKAVETWTPRVELEGTRRPAAEHAPAQPRSPGSEGYMVFLPPGSGGHKLGLPRIETIEEASSVALTAIEAFGVAKELWEDCGWGQVVDRYDLQEVARVSFDGVLSMASE